MIKMMWIIFINIAVVLCMPMTLLGAERISYYGADPGAPANISYEGRMSVNGQEMDVYDMRTRTSGIVLPGPNGAAVSPGFERPMVDPSYLDARELKLRIRELADQLLSSIPAAALSSYIAVPASFVNQDDFDESSSFGRYIAEQLFYEFNQRGFPVREYRYPGNVAVRPGEGEFILSRNVGTLSLRGKDVAFVTGTYYREADNIFINARMVRGSDGLVLRTAQLIVRNNALVQDMFRRSGRRLQSGSLCIVDYDVAKNPPQAVAPPPPPSTPFDRGLDIH